MEYEKHSEHKHHHVGYGTLILVWVALIALTSITVTVAGISLGAYTLFVALVIAAIKSSLVINIFMHIKFDEPIFKVFLIVSGFTLFVIFLLTFFDFIYRG
ncbi:MAG: cytochrome-c oxidase [Melioribacteraceae bacterium]|nr:MAG: cytochrome-c oxidase [Melioribacteraceae bacterium]